MKNEFDLRDGVVFGEKRHKRVVVREATAADVIDASDEAERVVMTADGASLLLSPTRLAIGVMRRRISIGDISHVDAATLSELSAFDLNLITTEIDKIDKAVAKEAAEKLKKLGRDSGAGATG